MLRRVRGVATDLSQQVSAYETRLKDIKLLSESPFEAFLNRLFAYAISGISVVGSFILCASPSLSLHVPACPCMSLNVPVGRGRGLETASRRWRDAC